MINKTTRYWIMLALFVHAGRMRVDSFRFQFHIPTNIHYLKALRSSSTQINPPSISLHQQPPLPPPQTTTINEEYIKQVHLSTLQTLKNTPEHKLITSHLLTKAFNLPSSEFNLWGGKDYKRILSLIQQQHQQQQQAPLSTTNMSQQQQQQQKPFQEIIQKYIQRRVDLEPVQYIVGEWDFHCLTNLRVRGPILIPRCETEELVDLSILEIEIHTLKNKNKEGGVNVLEIGTGTCCIPLSLASSLPNIKCTAIDISPLAVQLARENLSIFAKGFKKNSTVQVLDEISITEFYEFYSKLRLQAKLELESELESDGGVKVKTKFDIIVSNPPYIPLNTTLHPTVSSYEDPNALFAGSTGLDVFTLIMDGIDDVLEDGGVVVMELGDSHGVVVKALLEEEGRGMWRVEVKEDFRGKGRFVVIKRKS